MYTPEEYQPDNFWEERLLKCYQVYQQKLIENHGFDFDDLIMQTILLFRNSPKILEHYQTRFKYIMVDEYQDTNHAQYLFTKMLAEKHKNICVVGDDDQSIYSFRGADISNILEFEKDYDNVKVIRLEQNYRSTKAILDTANKVIASNLSRRKKRLWTEKEEGETVRFYFFQNEHQEAEFIAEVIIHSINEEHRKFSDFAVLYRVNAQSRILEDMFRIKDIPYTIVGGISFYERKEIKDAIAYLKVITNPADSVALKRIINEPPRRIGKVLISKLERYADNNNISLFEAMRRVEDINISECQIETVQKVVRLIDRFISIHEGILVHKLIEKVMTETGYIDNLKDEGSMESQARIENLMELINVAKEFEEINKGAKLHDFLSNISLVSDIDTWDNTRSCVTLMTLHNAKGLEFPYVFLTGMEEGLLPHINSLSSGDIEEERRLCYVGMTRAKEKLILTGAANRGLYNSNGIPSCFVKEAEVPTVPMYYI
jgi:DNA helicase-2/ATP-dependent DNA helicase PcrA